MSVTGRNPIVAYMFFGVSSEAATMTYFLRALLATIGHAVLD